MFVHIGNMGGYGGSNRKGDRIGGRKGLHAFALVPFVYPAESRPQQDRFDKERVHYI